MEGMSESDQNSEVDQQSEAGSLSEKPFLRTNSDDKLEETSNSEEPVLDLSRQFEAARRPIYNADSYNRSNSDTSVFSDLTDSPSPSRSLGNGMLSAHILTRLKRHAHKRDMNDEELEEALMKERFANLMLGGDYYGGTIGRRIPQMMSESIESLFTSIFNGYERLEPLDFDSKSNWTREMNFYTAPCEQMVRYEPTGKKLRQEDGSLIDEMESKPRSDIISMLRLLHTLDRMLLEITDTFEGMDQEIEYVNTFGESNGGDWWRMIPVLPKGGLSEEHRKTLKKQHKVASQIHKAAVEFNVSILNEMDVPESYLESLPKSGRVVLGDAIYRYLTSTAKFRPDEVIGYLNLTSEIEVLETVDKLEEAKEIWKRKVSDKKVQPKSSWKMVKELVTDADKNTVLAARADELISDLKMKYKPLSQSKLDTIKIQNNLDVVQAIFEAYSRVLEALSFKIVKMIGDVSAADKNMRYG